MLSMFLCGSYNLGRTVFYLGLFYELHSAFAGSSGPAERCENLQAPEHGSVSQSGSSYGSVAEYSCFSGYHPVGDTRRECGENGWDGTKPSCELKAGHCDHLEHPYKGFVEPEGAASPVGSAAKYRCDAGYNLHGNTKRTCNSYGMKTWWSGTEPSCEATECRVLLDPTNGCVKEHNISPGSIATYICKDGYSLVGNTQRKCQLNGSWSGEQPECKLTTISTGTPSTTKRLPTTTKIPRPILTTRPPDSTSSAATKKTTSHTDFQNKKALYIGVGAGIGGFLILLILVAVLSVLFRKRRQNLQNLETTEPRYSQPIQKVKKLELNGKHRSKPIKGRNHRSNQSKSTINSDVPPPVPLFLGMEKSNRTEEEMYVNMAPTAPMDNSSAQSSKTKRKTSQEKRDRKEENDDYVNSDSSFRSSDRQRGHREVARTISTDSGRSNGKGAEKYVNMTPAAPMDSSNVKSSRKKDKRSREKRQKKEESHEYVNYDNSVRLSDRQTGREVARTISTSWERSKGKDEEMYVNMIPTAPMDNSNVKSSKKKHNRSREKKQRTEESHEYVNYDNSVQLSDR